MKKVTYEDGLTNGFNDGMEYAAQIVETSALRFELREMLAKEIRSRFCPIALRSELELANKIREEGSNDRNRSQYEIGRAKGKIEGAAAERAKIVAWLKRDGGDPAANEYADGIDHGEHETHEK